MEGSKYVFFLQCICILFVSFSPYVVSLRLRASADNSGPAPSGLAKCYITSNGAKLALHFFVLEADRKNFEGNISDSFQQGSGPVGAPSKSAKISCDVNFDDDANKVMCSLCLYNEALENGTHARQGQVVDISLKNCMAGTFTNYEKKMENSEYHPVCYVSTSPCGGSGCGVQAALE